MDLLMVHPMEHLMELLMEIFMDRTMDKTINRMGTGINNTLTLRIMALQLHIVKIHHIMVFSCHPIQVKWEEATMAMAMVVMVISPM